MCLSFIKHAGEYEKLPRLSHFNISVILNQKNENIMRQYVTTAAVSESRKENGSFTIDIQTSWRYKSTEGTDLPNYKLFIVISKCLTKVTAFQ